MEFNGLFSWMVIEGLKAHKIIMISESKEFFLIFKVDMCGR